VKLSYAKVAEFQRRGLIHFHAVFRLDGHDPVHPERSVPPGPAFTAEVLAEVIQQVASTTWFATVSHPAKPRGWDIAWGAQVDPRVVRLTGGGEVTDTKVAAYLAKYATKSTEPVGVPPGRITARNASIYADPGTYEGRLIAACLRLGVHSHEDFRALRRWAHMFGYRGHFATKSRRYSTTMRALRAARRDWVRRQQPTARRENDGTVITVTDLRWAGRGWRTTGDALLALSAAARAREQRPALAHLPLRMITNGAVDRAVHGWIAEQCSRSTVKNSLAVLIRVMEQAVRDGIMDRNPARVIGWQRDYQRAEDELDDPRSLALPDWQALCDLAAALVARSADHFEGWGDVVIFAACTAARIGEVSGIRCADIDRDAWTWTVRRQTTPAPAGSSTRAQKASGPAPSH